MAPLHCTCADCFVTPKQNKVNIPKSNMPSSPACVLWCCVCSFSTYSQEGIRAHLGHSQQAVELSSHLGSREVASITRQKPPPGVCASNHLLKPRCTPLPVYIRQSQHGGIHSSLVFSEVNFTMAEDLPILSWSLPCIPACCPFLRQNAGDHPQSCQE